MPTQNDIQPWSETLGVIVTPGSGSSVDELLGKEDVLSLLKRHGAVLLRGFPMSKERFHRLADCVAGGRHREVVKSEHELHYHGEVTYMAVQLDVLWFYCITPAAEGGETKICDGVGVARALSVRSRRFFDANPLSYEFQFTPPVWRAMLRVETVEEAARVLEKQHGMTCSIQSPQSLRGWYSAGAIKKTKWGGEETFVNTLLHAVDPVFAPLQVYRLTTVVPPDVLAEVREITDRLTVLIPWQSGDVVAIDNTRLMHGRRAFRGPREILAVNGVVDA